LPLFTVFDSWGNDGDTFLGLKNMLANREYWKNRYESEMTTGGGVALTIVSDTLSGTSETLSSSEFPNPSESAK